MPFFDPADADSLASENLAVDAKIDLDGLSADAAVMKVDEALASSPVADRETRLWFWFAPASPTSGETLFLPVGRRLRDAVRNGIAVRAMPAQKGGWIVRLKAKAE